MLVIRSVHSSNIKARCRFAKSFVEVKHNRVVWIILYQTQWNLLSSNISVRSKHEPVKFFSHELNPSGKNGTFNVFNTSNIN